jgi:hypothetical protein
VQLHCTVQSIVIVLTFHQAPTTNLTLFFHSRSLHSLGLVLGKGSRRLLRLLCFLLFVLLIWHLLLLIQQGPGQKKFLAANVALCKAVKCQCSLVYLDLLLQYGTDTVGTIQTCLVLWMYY